MQLCQNAGTRADDLVKLEFFNPMSSHKDRLAVAMIAAMEADGIAGKTVVAMVPDFAERYVSSILFDGMDIWDE